MRKINLTLLFSFLVTVFCFAQEKPVNPVFGMWELGLSDYNGKSGTNEQIAQFKLYRADNTFQCYLIIPGKRRSVQTLEGTYTFKNDSVYTETIVNAVGTQMIGKSYDIVFYREGDQLRLKGSVDVTDQSGTKGVVHYNEHWDSVDFPKLN